MLKFLLPFFICLTLISSCGDKSVDNEKGAGIASGKYYCPMHPEVVSDKAASCSKCGMALEKK